MKTPFTHVEVRPYRLAFRKPFRTAHGTLTHREGWLLLATDADGVTGIGEAAPLPGFGGGDPRSVERALSGPPTAESSQGIMPILSATERSHFGLPPVSPPAATAALTTAQLDIDARKAGKPVHQFLARQARSRVPTQALVADAAEAKRAVEAGFRTLKVKVGVGDLEFDREQLRAIRKAAPTVALRIDANGAWSEQGAIRTLRRLSESKIEFCEQPVPAADIPALAEVRQASPIPIAADESVRNAADLERVITAEAADIVVLKPMFIGGIQATIALAKRAKQAGLTVVVTTALDAAVGRAMAAHAAAIVGQPGVAHGLATGHLLAEDVAEGFSVEDGHVLIPDTPGLGVSLRA